MTFTLCSTFTVTFCRGKENKDNVVLYFDSWPREELCIALPLKQVDNHEDHDVHDDNEDDHDGDGDPWPRDELCIALPLKQVVTIQH